MQVIALDYCSRIGFFGAQRSFNRPLGPVSQAKPDLSTQYSDKMKDVEELALAGEGSTEKVLQSLWYSTFVECDTDAWQLCGLFPIT